MDTEHTKKRGTGEQFSGSPLVVSDTPDELRSAGCLAGHAVTEECTRGIPGALTIPGRSLHRSPECAYSPQLFGRAATRSPAGREQSHPVEPSRY